MALDHEDVDLVRAEEAMNPSDANARWSESTSTLGDRSAYKKVWDLQAQDPDVA